MNNGNPQWTRRGFLQGSAAAMAAAYGLRPANALADIPNQFDGSKFQLAAPEPNPKHGGVLRVGILNRPPHFDFHQSGTVGSLGTQGCMFDNLIRHDPRDSGKTIIPDLAHSWEISKDGTTYTFFLRKGVLFHDGAELTADDVKATFDRIAKPPPGISIPRSTLFRAVSEINARDKYTVEFKLSAPRPTSFMMAAIASGWNGIVRKQTLEENNYNLRKLPNIPGTGPFKTVRRVENEVWVVERNKNYWNDGLPYLDGIEFYNLIPFSPDLGSAILSNRVDYARIVDPVTARKAKATPGMSTTAFNQSVIQGTWMNDRKKPFDDPRVRRAFHLALDRHVLVDVTKDVAPMRVGGFIYPFSEFATPTPDLFNRVGYQVDPASAQKEAQALMVAAGYADGIKGLDFMVRDVASFKLWAQAIQAMLQEGINVQCNLRTVVESVWFDDAAAGHFDLCIGAIVSTLLDPSDYFNAWYRTGGTQNYSFWSSPKFDGLVDQIDAEFDPAKRLVLIRQAEAIMEQDPPLLPLCWEQINDVWWNYVKGYNPYDYFGVYDVVRQDIFWLDK
ncbi:MAG TPA: ABC transporter substrate-binding protein [Acetobacteraceae bacterium]|jgi:peptide/nickel transport system substrate-binding protein|nr:ABC transporter substrate-binding protein [Acetobacteraceae bacterium]